MDPREMHEDDEGNPRWCEECCPVCELFDDIENGMSVLRMPIDEVRYPEWMERDPETGDVP
jgi:hypothetical protein